MLAFRSAFKTKEERVAAEAIRSFVSVLVLKVPGNSAFERR